jgi:hypothetical protein
MRFIFFTKTNWEETPRLRHQLAILLSSRGHTVVFFQRPSGPGLGAVGSPKATQEGIELIRTRQLIHHQLRCIAPLPTLNALYEARQIRGRVQGSLAQDDVIVNFNYDYYFLRTIFPKHSIISIFNDDFVAGARLSRRQALLAVSRTARSSTCPMSPRARVEERISCIGVTSMDG